MRAQIFEIIKKNIKEVLFDLDTDGISESDSLKNIGANSIDRVDIILMSMGELNIQCEMMEFSNARNIGDIISILESKSA